MYGLLTIVIIAIFTEPFLRPGSVPGLRITVNERHCPPLPLVGHQKHSAACPAPLTKLQITPFIPLGTWAIIQIMRSTTVFKMENLVVFHKCIALGLSNPILMNV